MYYFIEPMTEDDIEAVQKVEHVSFTTYWETNTYRQELREAQNSRYIVARKSEQPPPPRMDEQGGLFSNGLIQTLFSLLWKKGTSCRTYPLVGYGGLWIGVDEGHITTIAVHPAYRRQGIGELLLNGLIDLGFEMHATMLTLEVRVSNVAAQNLYLKYGFVPVGQRPRYYLDNGEDAMIMSTPPIQSSMYQERLREIRWQLFTRLRAQTALYEFDPEEPQNGKYHAALPEEAGKLSPKNVKPTGSSRS
jgi:ribosomal-protein-alanine N-acetyltransferase